MNRALSLQERTRQDERLVDSEGAPTIRRPPCGVEDEEAPATEREDLPPTSVASMGVDSAPGTDSPARSASR